jgi:hypothetical protein
MPRRSILSSTERESLIALPDAEEDLIRPYTFSETDLSIIGQRRGQANRLGFAVQLCYMRYPGVMLAVDEEPFGPLLRLVAEQLKAPPENWADYGRRAETRREHLLELQSIFGFQPFTAQHYRPAVQSLGELAWQTDKGIVLAMALVEGLRSKSVLLPSPGVIEHICAEAITRQPAHLLGVVRATLGRATARPWRVADALRHRQDDLACLAASVACKTELSAHARTHRAPQGLAGAQSTLWHRAAGTPESPAQDRPRGRPDDARRSGQTRATATLRHPRHIGHRGYGQCDR